MPLELVLKSPPVADVQMVAAAKKRAMALLKHVNMPLSLLRRFDDSVAQDFVTVRGKIPRNSNNYEPIVQALVEEVRKLCDAPIASVLCIHASPPPPVRQDGVFWSGLRSRVSVLTRAGGVALASSYTDARGRLVATYHLADPDEHGILSSPADPQGELTILNASGAPRPEPAKETEYTNHAYLEGDGVMVSVFFDGKRSQFDTVCVDGCTFVLTSFLDTSGTDKRIIVDWEARLVSPFLVRQCLIEDRARNPARHLRKADLTDAGRVLNSILGPIVESHLATCGVSGGKYRITEIDDREVCKSELSVEELSFTRSTVLRGLPPLLVSNWMVDLGEIVCRLGAHFGNLPCACGPESASYFEILRLAWARVVAFFVTEEDSHGMWMRTVDFVASEEERKHPGRFGSAETSESRKRRRAI